MNKAIEQNISVLLIIVLPLLEFESLSLFLKNDVFHLCGTLLFS